MSTDRSRPLVIGGALVDVKGKTRARLVPGTSNIGTVGRRPGGVGFNIAATLARLGAAPRFLSLVGRDDDGAWMLAECARAGLDADLVLRDPYAATATYLAILDSDGCLSVGVAAAEICERMLPDLLERHEEVIAASPLVVADLNLPAASVRWLSQTCRAHAVPLWIEPTAADKCCRLEDALQGVTYLSPNEEEVDALGGVARLLSAGVMHVFATLGADGVRWVSAAGERILPSRVVEVKDVTGAGDAFVAGTTWAVMHGEPMERALQFGISAALLTIQTCDSMPLITPQQLRETCREYFG